MVFLSTQLCHQCIFNWALTPTMLKENRTKNIADNNNNTLLLHKLQPEADVKVLEKCAKKPYRTL